MELHRYGDESDLQRVAVYNPDDEASETWVIYIHGGAWRDPKMDHTDGDHLIKAFKTGASIDYRLSPEVKHPEHLKDVLKGLAYLEKHYTIRRCILVGHSAGAFLILQSLIFAEDLEPGAADLLEKCDTFVGVEGIYNLKDLEKEDPSYNDFVINAFGDNKHLWDKASPASGLYRHALGSRKMALLSSPDDELLNPVVQPNAALNNIDGDITRYEASGKHDDVPQSDFLISVVRKYYDNKH